MKNVIPVLFLFVVITNSCSAQKTNKSNQKYPLAKVKDWAKSLLFLPENNWNNGDHKADTIIKQIGQEEFEKVKIYSNSNNIPCQFLIFCETRDGSPKKSLDTLRQRLGRLNAYKIASYSHNNYQGEISQWVILRVPYDENKNWDATLKWGTVYFILPKSEVEEIN